MWLPMWQGNKNGQTHNPLTLWDAFVNIQTYKKFKRTLIIRTKHDMHIFQGNPLYQAAKQHLKLNIV